MGMLSKFVASKYSGYAFILLVVALVGSGVWFWTEIKEFGSLSEKTEQQAREIEDKRLELATLNAQIQKKQDVLRVQESRTRELRQQAEVQRQEIREALDEAPQDYVDARNIIVPERLRFGPSRQNNGAEP